VLAVVREITWGLPAVAIQVRRWRRLARTIPDVPIREDALDALARKRGQTDGAALFSILPHTRHMPLLRLLVAYQVMWDYLDSVNERGSDAGPANGLQLHTALIDALDPTRTPGDYYRHHPWTNDGGYLRSLVDACRAECRHLPGFAHVQPLLIREATRARVLALNHHNDASTRDRLLRSWANSEFSDAGCAAWWELAAAASAGLTIFALLALAAEKKPCFGLIAKTRALYFPWVATTATMLDSYADQFDDVAGGEHSYIAHYATPTQATRRIGELVARCLSQARQLPNCEAHRLIISCMTAMYLSKDSSRIPELQASSRRIAEAGGTLTRALVPILRLWRIAYAQTAT
jgi:tetraprenyl-beta-curcumene synthase